MEKVGWIKFCPTVLNMNYGDDIKLKMVVDNDIEVPIYNTTLNNVSVSYDADPYMNNECLFTFCVPIEYYCLFAFVNDFKFDTRMSVKKFIQYINNIKNKENVNCIVELLNKYNRTDLIAILLDRNKNHKSFGDFEL